MRQTLWILASCACVLASSAQTRRALQVEDMLSMRRVAHPALSPDGRLVAYNVASADTAANAIRTSLHATEIGSGVEREITQGPAFNGNAAFSPDGKWIAFESTRSGESQIWLLPCAGGAARQFTTLSTGAAQAVWSPDGRSLAFVSDVFPEYSALPFPASDSLNRAALRAVEEGGVKARLITHLLYRHWNHWVNGRRAHIFIQSLDAGEPRDLTPGDRDAVPQSDTFSAGTEFAFSPDGSAIAYTAAPASGEAWSTNHDIYEVSIGGGTPRQITTNPAADGYPRYSPDGKFIAYRAQRRAGFEADRWELMLYDRELHTSRSLTPSFDAHVGAFAWAPDGRIIYFESEVEARTPIFALSIAGGNIRAVVSDHTNHDVTVMPGGRSLLFTRTSAVRPAEIYRSGVDSGQAEPVTHINDAAFARLEVPAPRSVTYTGDGGTPVQAWIYTPPGFDPAKKYPLVLMVHGGPQNAWTDSWSYRWNPALWSARGYVIMTPNPRGSTGFGQKFTDEVSRDWGGRAFVDLMHGLDYAEALPYVERGNVAAAGASFGGYMMNWFLGHAGDRFRAIVTHDGTYNAESNYGTTDELWFDEWEHGGPPWQDPEEFDRFSPHRSAARFRTPTLVIHGALDYRVPESEGMQLFTALQRQGVQSEFLYFPDEGHWVLKPANSLLWHRTVFAWLDRYLRH
ncbi:MAG TPA: S9 family peptidase [Bacteroidota bacterium]|nr:S9 family peptidase [Bacteroidota bacterium]